MGSSGLVRRVRKKVFLDTDDLQDLSRLFDYVGNHTDVAVALCSQDLLTRPWCMGELVTAKVNKVRMVRFVMPGFTEPDEIFIKEYETLVPDIACLTEHGISLQMVKGMLSWVSQCSSIGMYEGPSHATMNDACDKLVQITTSSQNLDVIIVLGNSQFKSNFRSFRNSLFKYPYDLLPSFPTTLAYVKVLAGF